MWLIASLLPKRHKDVPVFLALSAMTPAALPIASTIYHPYDQGVTA